MTRALAVLLVATLCAAMFGVDGSVWAAQDAATREAARRKAVFDSVSKIQVGSFVRVQEMNGRRIQGVLAGKMPDSIDVAVYVSRPFLPPRRVGTETIPLEEIRSIKKPLTAGQAAAITAGVVLGACAVANVVARHESKTQ